MCDHRRSTSTKKINMETTPELDNPLEGGSQHPLVRFVAYVVKSHRFFIRESYPYSGTAFIRHPFRWLRAYCHFMWSSTKDGFHQANVKDQAREG